MKHLKIMPFLLSVFMCSSMLMTSVVLADESEGTSEPTTTETSETIVKQEVEETGKKESIRYESEETEKSKPDETEETEPNDSETVKEADSESIEGTLPEEIEKSDRSYATSGKCGKNLTWSYKDGVLTISGTGKMNNFVPTAGAPWYSYREKITSVKLSSDVTSIGDSAFYGTSNLKSIIIPIGVQRIGIYAFGESGLTELELPDSVTELGSEAFFSCDNLIDVTIPGSLKVTGVQSFGCCDNLTTVTFSPGVTKIDDYMFERCKKLSSVSIPDTVNSIGKYAFSSSDCLKSITIPGSVKSIGESAFEYCRALDDVNINYGVTSIGAGAFATCYSLTSIIIPDSVETIGNRAFVQCTKLSSIKLSDNLKSISNDMFFYCEKLKAITIPDSVTSIGEWAFHRCDSLTDISFGKNLTSIGAWALYDCDSLTSITLPDSLKTIGQGAFCHSDYIKSITIPSNVTLIDKEAFLNCQRLKSVTIPDSVKTIGERAFDLSDVFTDVYYLGTEEEWKLIKISKNNTVLNSSTIHYAFCSIVLNKVLNGEATLSKNKAAKGDIISVSFTPNHGYELDAITVNGTVISGNSFVMGDKKTTVGVTFRKIVYSLTLNDTVNGSVELSAFNACVGDEIVVTANPYDGYYVDSIIVNDNPINSTKFKMPAENVTIEVVFSLIMPSNVGDTTTKAGLNYMVTNNADDGTGAVTLIGIANSMSTIVVPSIVMIKGVDYKVSRIASKAFYGDKSINTLSIGANVINIDAEAFYGCSNLKKVSGGSRIKTVGTKAFARCTKLSSFAISSKSLSKIGSQAFYKDAKLKTLTIKNTTRLTKSGVKMSLKGSYVKTVRVKKSKVKKYKKIFKRSNSGRKVKVKK